MYLGFPVTFLVPERFVSHDINMMERRLSQTNLLQTWVGYGNGPVTLGCDYRTILKSDPILLILVSELDVLILKIDKSAVTPIRFIGADFIARKMCQWFVLRYSSRAIFSWSHYYDSSEPILLLEKCVKNIVLRLFKNRHWFANRITNLYRLFFNRIRFCIWPKNWIRRSHDRWKIGSDMPILKLCDSRALVWLWHIRS